MKRTLLLATALFAFAAPNLVYADEINNTEKAVSTAVNSENIQKSFTDIATKYRNAILSPTPKNDIQIRLLLKKRTKEFNALNFDGVVKDWVGTVDYTSATGDTVFLDIEIAPKVQLSVKTDIDNPFVEAIAVLQKNQKIIFSGNLIPDTEGTGFEEISMTTKGSLKEPEFSFNLTNIDLAH